MEGRMDSEDEGRCTVSGNGEVEDVGNELKGEVKELHWEGKGEWGWSLCSTLGSLYSFSSLIHSFSTSVSSHHIRDSARHADPASARLFILLLLT